MTVICGLVASWCADRQVSLTVVHNARGSSEANQRAVVTLTTPFWFRLRARLARADSRKSATSRPRFEPAKARKRTRGRCYADNPLLVLHASSVGIASTSSARSFSLEMRRDQMTVIPPSNVAGASAARAEMRRVDVGSRSWRVFIVGGDIRGQVSRARRSSSATSVRRSRQ